MTTATIDPATLHLLQHQGRRMHAALHDVVPPDRKKALEIQLLVDDILDRRPRPIAVTSDGEILYEGTSPYVVAQAVPAPAASTVVNTGPAEPVLPMSAFGSLDGETPEPPVIDQAPDEFTEGPGGVAVLDREQIRDAEPGDGRERPPITQAEIDQIRREMES